MAREILEGKVFSSKRHGDFEVLEYLGDNEGYSIQFIKTGTISTASKQSIETGLILDRFSPYKCGIGFLGDKHVASNFLYTRWSNMLNRCYVVKNKSYKYYGAKGIVVCDRWHNFSNYVEDVIAMEGYDEELAKSGKIHLDKDIINRDAKIYSPETCKWVTKSENTKERNKRVCQKYFVATRLSDNYKEENYNMTEFCKKYELYVRDVRLCLIGERNDYAGWKFEYRENPIQYKQKNASTNKSGYKGICKENRSNKWRVTANLNHKQVYLGLFTDIKDAIIARYNWEIENQGVYRKPDSKDDYLKSIGHI
jgi:hypothetical protein